VPESIPARIAPLEPPYEPEAAERLAKWMPPGSDAEPLALSRTLVVHGELASRMRPLGAGILGHGLVDARLREVMIHRTCALCAHDLLRHRCGGRGTGAVGGALSGQLSESQRSPGLDGIWSAAGRTDSLSSRTWKGGRAVECTGLENRQAGNPRFGSSNLPPSVQDSARTGIAVRFVRTRWR
jgi:hypothetical protein